MSKGTAIILAGGQSRRMGREKATIRVEGETLLERTARVVRPLFESIIVVMNKDLGIELPDALFTPDIIPGVGPIGGLHAGLALSETEDNFVVAVDMPFVSAEIIERIRALRDGADVALPQTQKGLEPLCASYSKRCLEAIDETISAGHRRIVAFFDRVNVRPVSLDDLADIEGAERAFLNVNTESDLVSVLEYGGNQCRT
ncbi:MAG: molybdenum cofactor guanylyltransferase [Candidatus Aquicultorales bacterium]